MNNICTQDGKRTHQSYFPEERLIQTSHERELWAEALYVGVEESKWTPEGGESQATLDRKLRARDEARRFISDEEGMFDVICRILDMDPERTRRNIKNQWGDKNGDC